MSKSQFGDHCANEAMKYRLYKTETVYTCDNCPHRGNLMCCHNCPNF